MMHGVVKSLGLVFLAAWLSACGQKEEAKDLEHYIKKTKAQPPSEVEPIPEFSPLPPETYQASSGRNPFQGLDQERNTFRPDQNRRKEILENYPLESLRLGGVLHYDGVAWAVILTPDGKVHRAKVGHYLGQNYGKITKIEPKTIYIEETIRSQGGWEARKAALVVSTPKAAP